MYDCLMALWRKHGGAGRRPLTECLNAAGRTALSEAAHCGAPCIFEHMLRDTTKLLWKYAAAHTCNIKAYNREPHRG